MRRFLYVLTVFSLVAAGSAFAQERTRLDPPKMGDMIKLETYEAPKKLPEVLLSSPNGLVYLSQHKRKFLVINLWATWCPPCVQELPSLNALQQAMKSDEFEVITVSLDVGAEGLEDARRFLAEKELTELTPYVDANNEMQRLDVLKGVNGIPVTLLVDANSNIVARYQGDADWNGRAARAVIDYYLANTKYNAFDGIDFKKLRY